MAANQAVGHSLHQVTAANQWARARAVGQAPAVCRVTILFVDRCQLHRWEFAGQIGRRHLEDMLGLNDVTQPTLSEVT